MNSLLIISRFGLCYSLLLFFSSPARCDVTLLFSSSESYLALTSVSITEGGLQRIYLFARDDAFSANSGLGAFDLSVGSAGIYANVGSAQNIVANTAFSYSFSGYGDNSATLSASMDFGGVTPTNGDNKVYLGYFDLQGIANGSASLSANGNPSEGAWFYGNNDLIGNVQSASLQVDVTAVPEVGTMFAFCLGVLVVWIMKFWR